MIDSIVIFIVMVMNISGVWYGSRVYYLSNYTHQRDVLRPLMHSVLCTMSVTAIVCAVSLAMRHLSWKM